MKKRIFIMLILTFCGNMLFAQEGRCPKIPETYEWLTPEDYIKDQDLVKKTLRWLCNTPLGIDVRQRSLANTYVMEWLAGTPTMQIEIKTNQLSFYESQPDLLFCYIHGIALYKIDKPNTVDPIVEMTKGLETIAELVLQSEELSKDSSLRPILKAYKKKKLKEYSKEICQPKKKK